MDPLRVERQMFPAIAGVRSAQGFPSGYSVAADNPNRS